MYVQWMNSENKCYMFNNLFLSFFFLGGSVQWVNNGWKWALITLIKGVTLNNSNMALVRWHCLCTSLSPYLVRWIRMHMVFLAVSCKNSLWEFIANWLTHHCKSTHQHSSPERDRVIDPFPILPTKSSHCYIHILIIMHFTHCHHL